MSFHSLDDESDDEIQERHADVEEDNTQSDNIKCDNSQCNSTKKVNCQFYCVKGSDLSSYNKTQNSNENWKFDQYLNCDNHDTVNKEKEPDHYSWYLV